MAGLIAAGAGAKIAFLTIALAFLKKGGVLLFIAGAAIVRFAKGLFGQKRPRPPDRIARCKPGDRHYAGHCWAAVSGGGRSDFALQLFSQTS